MNRLEIKQYWSNWFEPSRLSLIGSISSLLVIIIGLSSLFLIKSNTEPGIHEKLEELDNIQSALSTLNSYVEGQQNTLKELSTNKDSLIAERDKIQKLLIIDRENADSLLKYLLAKKNEKFWLEILVSFFVGVLSSSLVTLLAVFIQSKKHKTD